MNYPSHHRIDAVAHKVNALEERLEELGLSVGRLDDRLSRLEGSCIPEGEPVYVNSDTTPSDITRAKLCNLLERLQDIRGELIELLETRLKHTDQQEKVEDNLRLMRGGAHSLYNLLNNYMRF